MRSVRDPFLHDCAKTVYASGCSQSHAASAKKTARCHQASRNRPSGQSRSSRPSAPHRVGACSKPTHPELASPEEWATGAAAPPYRPSSAAGRAPRGDGQVRQVCVGARTCTSNWPTSSRSHPAHCPLLRKSPARRSASSRPRAPRPKARASAASSGSKPDAAAAPLPGTDVRSIVHSVTLI